MEVPTVQLADFRPVGLARGRSRGVEICWWLTKLAFIQAGFPWPMRFKRWLLIRFGAQIGRGFYIRPRVNIHFPWKLVCGDNVWIGEGTVILNLEPVTLENNVALAHEVFVAAAGHDIRDPSFGYENPPRGVKEGAWLATRCYVGPGVIVGRSAVVAAGAVVTKHVGDGLVVGGVPAREIGRRRLEVSQ